MPDPFTQYAVGSKEDPFAAFSVSKAGEAAPMTRPVLGHPLSATEGEPSALDNLNEAMAPAAHPQSAIEMFPLLLSRPIGEALNMGTSAMRAGMRAHPEMTGVTGRIRAGLTGIASAWRGPQPLSEGERAIAGTVGRIRTAQPTATVSAAKPDVWDTALNEERAARTAAPSAQAGPASSPATTPGLSGAERAQLAKQGYSPELIDKIAAQAGEAGAAPSVTPMASHAPPESAMRQPRVEIGAERVGRQAGMTKEQVRLETGPVLDEAVGDASPILPQKALNNIIDTVKSLPKDGGAREAYVQAATSGKARWQIENVRRTLEHLGLIVPAAAAISPDVRGMLLDRMRRGVSGTAP